MPFCAYFKYNSKTTMYLQLCHTPKNSSTTRDALFHVTSGKAVATYKVRPQTSLFCYLCAIKITTKLCPPTTLVHTKLPLYYKNEYLYKCIAMYNLRAPVQMNRCKILPYFPIEYRYCILLNIVYHMSTNVKILRTNDFMIIEVRYS